MGGKRRSTAIKHMHAVLHTLYTPYQLPARRSACVAGSPRCSFLSLPLPLPPAPRLIAYSCPNPVAANAFGGFSLLILILLSGFSIIRGERVRDTAHACAMDDNALWTC